MPRRHTILPALGTAVLTLWAGAAAAQTAPAAAPQPTPPAATGFWEQSSLLGNPAGLRDTLGNLGVSLGLQETSEVFGNVTGGIHRGADYNGLTEMSLGIDTQKAFGWAGGTFNVSGLQIHGRYLSVDNLDTLQTASGIEAQASTRLWELWYQQAFLHDRVDVKLGQQSIDQEFMVSQNSSLFINTAMGWPLIPSVDLYAGGPAYPLSSLGVRLRARPTAALTVLAGVFDDNPPGGPFANDTQLLGAEAAGHAFNLNTGALWIAELQYAINQPASDGTPSGLAGTYKLGFWYDSGSFPDQRFDTLGLSLDNPQSSGVPRLDRGNASVYALADQTVWARGPRALAVFARAMGAPPDRNLISFSVDAGLTLKAPFPGRDNDTAGIGFGLAKVSGDAAATEQNSGVPGPVRGTETFIEVTYQLQLTPWWLLQPDFQYVFNPGGGVVNPQNPPQRVGNEAVFGLRTAITLW